MGASQVLASAPVAEPLTLDDLKRHLKIEALETREDGMIRDLLVAARLRCEELAGRAFLTQTWDYFLDAWPSYSTTPGRLDVAQPAVAIELPRSPVQSVSFVKYTDAGGQVTTVPTSVYTVDLANTGRARIVPKAGQSWPSPTAGFQSLNAIEVEYVAGYGDEAASVPGQYKQAIRQLVAHWYTNRAGESSLPPDVVALLTQGSVWYA